MDAKFIWNKGGRGLAVEFSKIREGVRIPILRKVRIRTFMFIKTGQRHDVEIQHCPKRHDVTERVTQLLINTFLI